MIAASRLVNISRTVMPYASWALYVVQLGYVGYNLYNYYQDYLAQVERDQRSGTQRGLDETIELVVARRRRRIDRQLQSDQQQQQQQQQQQYQTTTIQEQPQQESVTGEVLQDQASHSAAAPSAPTIVHIDDDDESNPSNNQHTSNSNNNSRAAADERNKPEDQENSAQLAEQINRDRHSQQYRVEVDPLGNETVHIDDDDDDDDEVLSDSASLSLESTDSNRGIIKDMYSECFICARTLNDPSKQVATLPFCLHPFHKTCLDGVLKWHRKCPVCDFDIFSPI